jgi:predicted PhzF superfamily epimerase YddE/YHI9
MQAGLFDSAKANQLLPADSRKAVIEQGHFIDRPGFAKVESAASEIMVTGSAVHVFSTKLEL